MTIAFACPACRARLKADDDRLNETLICPECGKPAPADPGTVPAAEGLDRLPPQISPTILVFATVAIVVCCFFCLIAWGAAAITRTVGSTTPPQTRVVASGPQMTASL